jgi:hypothetical protein
VSSFSYGGSCKIDVGSHRISTSLTRLACMRLESTIAAEQNLLQQLRGSSSQTHLDALYAYVLSTCSSGDEAHAGKVFGSVMLLIEPITLTLLAAFLEVPAQDLAAHLRAFVDARLLTTESPLEPITDTTPLRVCHDSLREFVVDPLRCRVKHYLLNPVESHARISHRCLQMLNKHLRQDICGIRDYELANADIPDLHARITQSIPEAMRYACQFWPVHLAASGPLTEPVSSVLLEFCTEHLLHWLEVLSLLGELSVAGRYLPQVLTWCKVRISSDS